MISPLAPRILALPADVRATLAEVDGPGWRIYGVRDGCGTVTERECIAAGASPHLPGESMDDGCIVFGWIPANPAASVAAVMRCSIWYAHRLIADNGAMGGDTPAALSIIEAHVAKRSTHG